MIDKVQFTQVLHEWSEIFMRRSMHDLVQFTRQAGLSMSQLSALMRLYHGGACGVSDLGEHLGVSSAAASQMIERLVQQGLLERSEHPDDRRIKRITVSAAGRRLIAEGVAARRRWMESLTLALTQEEQALIVQALELLTRAAHQQEPNPAPQS
jgi:DNA-binding MarR family transcriptional regulator